MSTTTKHPKTAGDLIGYEGKQAIRLPGKRHGRALYTTVVTRDGYKAGGPVILERIDTIPARLSDEEPTTKVVRRSVDAKQPIELVTAPVGQMIKLPGDSWITDEVTGKQWHASGAVVEIVKVNHRAKTVTAWVAHRSLIAEGNDVPVGIKGQLDVLVGKMIIDRDFDTDNGWQGKPLPVSPSEVARWYR